MSSGGDYHNDRPAGLTGAMLAPTRTILFRLAAGEDIVTRHYGGDHRSFSLNVAHRRGYVESRRFGPPKPHGKRLTGAEISYWRHSLTPRGRAALAELMPCPEVEE